jgi:hypothetical protein
MMLLPFTRSLTRSFFPFVEWNFYLLSFRLRWQGETTRSVVRGALVAYTAVIIGIFILGSALPIQLPTITFGEGSQRQSGLLLGDPRSVCGYWYYIDATGRVVALPSEKATDVVVEGGHGATMGMQH